MYPGKTCQERLSEGRWTSGKVGTHEKTNEMGKEKWS